MASADLHIKSSNQHGSFSPALSSPTNSSRSGSDTVVMVESPTSSTDHECNYCNSNWEKMVKGLSDPDDNPQLPLHGWPELAQLINKNPDLESFQPFRELHIKSLLYYQAELDGLKSSLHDTEWNDHRYGEFGQAGNLGKRVDQLLDCEHNETEEGRYQLDLIKKIRQVLKEYSKLNAQC